MKRRGFPHELYPVQSPVKKSQVVIHTADKPHIVSHLPNTHTLAREHGAELHFAAPNADAAALGDVNHAFVARVLWLF